MNSLSVEEKCRILGCLTEGMSIRATSRITAGRKQKKKKRLKPLSLHPMDFDEAMRKILAAAKKPDRR